MLPLLLACLAADPPPTVPRAAIPVRVTVQPPSAASLPLPAPPTGPPVGGFAVPALVMPNGGAPLKFQQVCPGDVAQPFQRQPRVKVVGPCQTDPSAAPGAGATSNLVWEVEFDDPASIPLPRFDPAGGKPVCDTDGLVIYEGMRLTVDAGTGTYDVAFTATVPGCLTVLRLQLLFDPPADTSTAAPKPGGRSYTLTLPPIRLDPPTDGDQRGNTDTLTFHVHHRGYSSMFVRDVANAGLRVGGRPQHLPVDQAWPVRRSGVARFGLPVAVDDVGR